MLAGDCHKIKYLHFFRSLLTIRFSTHLEALKAIIIFFNDLTSKNNKFYTHCAHILTRSLSVVPCCKPLIYKLVFDNCSPCCGVLLGPIVLTVLFVLLLKLVLNVPLCDPVFDELLEFVLLGDAAVGTRWPYCKEKKGEESFSWHFYDRNCVVSIRSHPESLRGKPNFILTLLHIQQKEIKILRRHNLIYLHDKCFILAFCAHTLSYFWNLSCVSFSACFYNENNNVSCFLQVFISVSTHIFACLCAHFLFYLFYVLDPNARRKIFFSFSSSTALTL